MQQMMQCLIPEIHYIFFGLYFGVGFVNVGAAKHTVHFGDRASAEEENHLLLVGVETQGIRGHHKQMQILQLSYHRNTLRYAQTNLF